MPKTAKKTAAPQTERHSFNAEVSRVLHLMIHALYTNRDIFLRELISNASDACDKLRYEATQNDALLKDNAALEIHLSYDEKAGTLTITDTGIGMSRDELVANLGTIAKSGTREFASALSGDAKKDASLIGQFGVGFYASFMVADTVEVHSRKAGEAESWRWQSDGLGSFSVEPAEDRARGTSITLRLKADAKEYLDKHKLTHIAQTYSDHISFPIILTDAEGNSQNINEGSAIWARPKNEITDAQYQQFYKHVAHAPDTPWLTLHHKAEGTLEFTSLLYVPGRKPLDLFQPERRRRVKLYVKRVYITDEGVELIPPYLRFVRGVVDSADLPLNISRETLQKNALIAKMRDAITSKLLSEFKKRAEKDAEDYKGFWSNFGAAIKEGLCEATAPRDKLLEISRFYSTHGEEMTSLDAYKSRMREGQEAIYYLVGDSLAALRNSPQIEGFKKRGIEVLLLTDHVDDFWTNVTTKYGDIALRSAIRAGEDLQKFPASGEEVEKETPPAEGLEALMEAMRTLYGEQVREVRTTAKLAESPVCLAVGEGEMEMRMERFLAEHNQIAFRMPKILEINPQHPLIGSLATKHAAGENVDDALWLLLDQARIAEGEPLPDASAFLRRLNALMGGS